MLKHYSTVRLGIRQKVRNKGDSSAKGVTYMGKKIEIWDHRPCLL